jgi:hypothetical protein
MPDVTQKPPARDEIEKRAISKRSLRTLFVLERQFTNCNHEGLHRPGKEMAGSAAEPNASLWTDGRMNPLKRGLMAPQAIYSTTCGAWATLRALRERQLEPLSTAGFPRGLGSHAVRKEGCETQWKRSWRPPPQCDSLQFGPCSSSLSSLR